MILQKNFKATAVCSDSLAVVKTIRNRDKALKTADASHRVLLQSIDTVIQQGAVPPQWVRSHAERRKKDKANWTIDEWGNHIADRTADNKRMGQFRLQPTVVSAIEVLKDLPQIGELYIGDSNGLPIVLNGIMDHVHSIRQDRYITKRDRDRPGGPKWQDNTIQLAAKIYNGKSTSISTYGHTARVIFDKHWHGRNRGKANPADQNTQVCHMCGGNDSQSHSFRWCTHSNVVAIRQEVNNALHRYLNDVRADKATDMYKGHKIQLIQGVIHEFHTCPDAARAWTGNWNRAMITRLERRIRLGGITKKECTALRSTLLEVYSIIAQGANDILDIRHSVDEVQKTHQYYKEMQKRTQGQTLITEYLLDRNGVSGRDRNKRQLEEYKKLEEDLQDEMQSETSQDHDVSESPSQEDSNWIPKVTVTQMESMQNKLMELQNENECIATVHNTYVKGGSIRALLQGEELTSDTVQAYMKIKQRSNVARHLKVMNVTFFERLYNPTGSISARPASTLDLKEIVRDTREFNIFEYQMVHIPVRLKKHWAFINVDMGSNSIRFIDSDGDGGGQYANAIRRWLMAEWKRFYKDSGPHWKIIPTISCLVPQQTNAYDCGVFMLMFMDLMAEGRDVSKFTVVERSWMPGNILPILYCVIKERRRIAPGHERNIRRVNRRKVHQYSIAMNEKRPQSKEV